MSLTDLSTLARLERPLRPWLTRLPAPLALRLYFRGRRAFLDRLALTAPRGRC